MTSDHFTGLLNYVNKKSKYVLIDNQALDLFVKNFTHTKISHWCKIYPLGYKRRKKDEDEADFLFLIGSQAFCFWGFPNKWTINYKGKKLDGWWALVASFEKALEKGLPILNGNYLAQLSLQDLKNIFFGHPEIPLLTQRKKILNRIGVTLADKYENRFHNFLKSCKSEAFELLCNIADEFYGFDDTAIYKGKRILFYKKAQVVLTDINFILNNKGLGKIKNIEKLPGHADYKIPAILRKLGILIYNKELSDKVDQRIEITSGSVEEIEIRANMLLATHIISDKLKSKYPQINPVIINGVLWSMSQRKEPGDKPYHLTRTIYY